MSIAEPAVNGVATEAAASVFDAAGGLKGFLDAAQTNILVADTDFTLVYANAHAVQTFTALEVELVEAFGVPVSELLGGSIHRFHRDPSTVEAIVNDPAQLPHSTRFPLGSLTLETRIDRVTDADGEVVGYVATVEPVTGGADDDVVRELAENTRAVTAVIEVLDAATTPDDAATAALNTVRAEFGWDYGSYWVRENGDGDLVFSVESGTVTPEFAKVTQEASFAHGVGLAGRTWQSRELTFEVDLGTVTDCVRAPAARNAGVKSGVAFPIVVDGDVIGTMDFFALETLTLSEERLAALRSVGRSVSSAMERLRRAAETREQAQNASAVSKVLEVLATARNGDEAATAALDTVRAEFGWDYGSYWVRENGDGDLVFSVESGTVTPEFAKVTQEASFAHGVGLAGRTWQSRELTFEVDLGTVTDCVRAPAARNAGVKSGVAFPIVVDGDVIGTMDFFALETLTLSEDRLAALRSVGSSVSEAMERFARQVEVARVQSMMENAPTNMMFADKNLVLQYMNPKSRETLATLEEYLPVSIDEVVGSTIDIFHTDPEHQRGILGNPEKHLPMRSNIQVGPEILDLLVSPIHDHEGNYIGAMASWEVITEQLRLETEMNRVMQMMENAPTNMMFADKDLNLQYMNPKSRETLATLEEYLPVSIDEVVGSNIDIFHTNPEHQRGIFANPEKHLPMRSNIQVGPEILDLLVSPIEDSDGNFIGAMASWEVITDKLRLENEMARVNSMMENSPTNMMFADKDLVLRYMNPASLNTLKTLEEFLPVKAEEMIGQTIDIFHSNPAHQRGILANPEKHLPMRSNIQVGPETLDLLVSAILDAEGNYIGAMASWEVITEKLRLERETAEAAERERVAAEELRAKVDAMLEVVEAAAAGDLTREVSVAGEDAIGQMGEGLQRLLSDLRTSIAGIANSASTLSEAANELTEVSTSMEANATETSAQAKEASDASASVASNVETVAAAAEEMSVSIREISQNTSHAVQVARDAVTAADTTMETINKLGDSSAEIGKIIKVITDIAQQTNLLALNATIEAARAGESGKGFAVVANEVKELAKETARATEDISEKIETIQTDTTQAVSAITEISGIIDSISEIQTTIASAVEEQAATTSEISRSVQEANNGSSEITRGIGMVAEAANSTSEGAAQTQQRAEGLTRTSAELNDLVSRFTY